MSSTLKMVFSLPNTKSVTLSLSEPKTGLTQSQVSAVASDILTRSVLVVGGANPTALKEAYITTTERVELADN